uniref:HOOK_N domain-containing protein n=1 Tax=Hydatigena taeniaeformis TaxID=6205 RepID=A0A158RF22_HYDTA
LSNASAFTRLRNWKMLVKNLEEFFIEELQHLMVIAPPSIFHIIFSPSSCAAKSELERVTLLLLLAAIKCKRRELYIRDIMNNLSTETQKGIMQSITSLTEYADTTVSLTGAYELPSGLRYNIRRALSSRVELYFLLAEEVLHRICDNYPDWTPSKRNLFSPQQEKRQEKDFDVKISRSRSLTSSLDFVGLAFKRSNEARHDVLKSPQSVETDTATTSETGYESRPPTDKPMREELKEKRDHNSLLGSAEIQLVNDGGEKANDTQITRAKAKLRQQSLLISEQADQLEEVQSQLAEMRAEVDRLRTERARLADAAAAARHWRDEADAGQQAIVQLRESERTCEKLKQRLEAALYYRVRCQELSEEVESLTKARDALETRLSEHQDEQSKIYLLNQKLMEQSQRIMDLETQRGKDIEEICRLKNEVTESRIDALSMSRRNLTARSISPSSSDYERNELFCRFPSLQIETSAADSMVLPPCRNEASQTHEEHDANTIRIQEFFPKELEQTLERCASHLKRVRSKLNFGYGRVNGDQGFDTITEFNGLQIRIGDSTEALMKGLEQTILDIIEAVEENDKKLVDLEKRRFFFITFLEEGLSIAEFSISDRKEGDGIKVVRRKGVSTLPTGEQGQFGANEAVREALLQTTEAKTRIAVLCREKDEVTELLKSTEHELELCKGFLKPEEMLFLGLPMWLLAVISAMFVGVAAWVGVLFGYENRNTYLEKENRNLLLQLRALLSQNKDVVAEDLGNSECQYREKLALRDELALMQHNQEQLEEKLVELYKTLPSPKKAKSAISFLQKVRDALLKTKDVYTLDNSHLSSTDGFEQGIEQVLHPSNLRWDEVKDNDNNGRLLDFQRFVGNLERPQSGPHLVSHFDKLTKLLK